MNTSHTASHRKNLLRARGSEHGHARVTNVELFFDLVFVFAITQLSHLLLEHFTLAGALQTGMLTLAIWWVWIFTSWTTNWLDPETTPVRLMLFALMIIGVVMSSSLPGAFKAGGHVFAMAYVAMQLGRTIFGLYSFKGGNPANVLNFQRVLVWFIVSGIIWIAGAYQTGAARAGLWALALAIEYTGPVFGFFVPGLGRTSTRDWNVDGSHMAERCSLFVIIALGESILVTGATFAKLAWSPPVLAALLGSLIGSIAMWWIYFNIGAERATKLIAASDDPGRIARLAYTYLHLPIVAGIILTAVADEFVLAHPTGHTETKMAVAVIGGPLLYLAGTLCFKRSTSGWFQPSHVVGLGLLLALVPAAPALEPVALNALASLVLVTVAVWETLSLRSKEN